MRVGVFSYPTTDEVNPALLFETEAISEALRSSGHDTSRLATPYAPKPSGLGRPPSPIDGRLGQTPHTSQSSPSSVEERDITESFRHYTLSTQDTGTAKYEIFFGIFVCKLGRRKLSLSFIHCTIVETARNYGTFFYHFGKDFLVYSEFHGLSQVLNSIIFLEKHFNYEKPHLLKSK